MNNNLHRKTIVAVILVPALCFQMNEIATGFSVSEMFGGMLDGSTSAKSIEKVYSAGSPDGITRRIIQGRGQTTFSPSTGGNSIQTTENTVTQGIQVEEIPASTGSGANSTFPSKEQKNLFDTNLANATKAMEKPNRNTEEMAGQSDEIETPKEILDRRNIIKKVDMFVGFNPSDDGVAGEGGQGALNSIIRDQRVKRENQRYQLIVNSHAISDGCEYQKGIEAGDIVGVCGDGTDYTDLGIVE